MKYWSQNDAKTTSPKRVWIFRRMTTNKKVSRPVLIETERRSSKCNLYDQQRGQSWPFDYISMNDRGIKGTVCLYLYRCSCKWEVKLEIFHKHDFFSCSNYLFEFFKVFLNKLAIPASCLIYFLSFQTKIQSYNK